MITFSVLQQNFGWAVRLGERMSTPFWSKARAVTEANHLADRLRRHGASVEVIVEVVADSSE
jgi:hypothetical protein